MLVVPALSVERLTVLVYASLFACALLLLAVLALGLRLARIRRTYAQVLDGVPHGDLLAAVSRQIQSVRDLQRTTELIGRETAQLRQRVSSAVRTVGFARYDAFPDVGGQLSFSTALLDEAGDGVVLTTINGRTNSRSYAKAVKGGRSDYQLSNDERAAIAMAMGESDQPVARSHA
jgi:Protein of unknown function (DUF4446)